MEGSITLIKANLFNLPMYILSVFRIPKRVAAASERIQRSLVWSRGDNKGSYNIRWNRVCKRLEDVGIGVRKFCQRNWVYSQNGFGDSPLELSALWDKVTISIPDINKNGWDTEVQIRAKTKSPWREISRVMRCFGQQLGVQVGIGPTCGLVGGLSSAGWH